MTLYQKLNTFEGMVGRVSWVRWRFWGEGIEKYDICILS